LGESLVASGSGGTGGDLSLVFSVEEALDGSELLVSVGNGGGEGGLVSVVLGVLASSKSLGNYDICGNPEDELLGKDNSGGLIIGNSLLRGSNSGINKVSSGLNSCVGSGGS